MALKVQIGFNPLEMHLKIQVNNIAWFLMI